MKKVLFGILVVFNQGNIYNVETNGTVTCSYVCAGIAGQNEGSISQCTNGATIRAKYIAGGLAGWGNGDIIECINKGDISIYGNPNPSVHSVDVGGIIASIYPKNSSTEIRNCYNIGEINGVSSTLGNVGGIVGLVFFTSEGTGSLQINIENCYNVGKIGSGKNKGGINGLYLNNSGKTTIKNYKNNYWLSGVGSYYGEGNPANDTGMTGKTSEQLKQTAESLGNAYTSDTNNINQGYPILKWQTK